MCPSGTGYNYFLAYDAAERIIFAVVAGSGSGKLCWHSRGNDNDQENAGYVRESAGGSEQALRAEEVQKRSFCRCFWLLLSPQTKVARAGARNYPCAAAADAVRVGAGTLVVFGDYQIAPIAARSTAMGRWRLTPPGYGGTCLPAGRSVRGYDTPPACHSTPRTHQGEGLAPAGGCSKKVHGFPAKLKGRIKESEYAIKQKER